MTVDTTPMRQPGFDFLYAGPLKKLADACGTLVDYDNVPEQVKRWAEGQGLDARHETWRSARGAATVADDGRLNVAVTTIEVSPDRSGTPGAPALRKVEKAWQSIYLSPIAGSDPDAGTYYAALVFDRSRGYRFILFDARQTR